MPGIASETDLSRRPPNFLLITADNLGYGDLPCYNPASTIKSPNLNRLAAEGARLRSFYTASPTCTVSRACLLTGRIPQRHGLTEQLGGVEGNYGVGLDQNEVLIPQVLKQAPTPYATGCFGKWNIGFAEGSRPTERGFDEFIGNASGNIDYYRHNYREKHDLYRGTEELHREGEYSTDLFADAAIAFIRRKAETEKPWFCYLPFNASHFPSPGNRIEGEPNVWQAPDWALEAAGVAKNTFVFFMSDNGAFRLGCDGLDVGSNEPLRNGGVTCWEGGLRVPAMARCPGKIAPGTIIDAPLWSPDLLIACAELSGAPRPDVILDGKKRCRC
ncbi:MAG: sulfatase-like hydrolase/transferase [Candidatus Hydrogenedentes bacterium]|nr:sulfatase-like hydrolase/transferase [Candidatus Hydrogenedentota bacterium]